MKKKKEEVKVVEEKVEEKKFDFNKVVPNFSREDFNDFVKEFNKLVDFVKKNA